MNVYQVTTTHYQIEKINDPYSVLRMLGEQREGVDIDAVYANGRLTFVPKAAPSGKDSPKGD